MLSLLVDENVSPEVVLQIAHKRPDIEVISVHTWHSGHYRGKPDEVSLAAASVESMTLLTYDLRTILPILEIWGQLGVDHTGVVFVDDRSIANNDFGGLVRAIIQMWDNCRSDMWVNRVDFLRPYV